MKKLLALLSLTAFLAVSVNAQSNAVSAPEAKTETVKSDAKAPAHGCCVKANTSCCKNNKEAMKNCTPDQKAACAKAGKDCSAHAKATTGHAAGCDHSKADATDVKENKSGLK